MSPHATTTSTSTPAPEWTVPLDFHPSYPQQTASLSYWHRSTRAFRYLHYNSQTPLPTGSTTPYVIIGAGLTGSLTAFNLLEAGVSPSSIVILEAREAVCGASGRNTGQVRSESFRDFSQYAALHGTKQALQIVQIENLNLELIEKFVKEHNIQCDFVKKRTFDVCCERSVAEDEENNIQEFEEAGGDISGVKVWDGEQEIKANFGLEGAIKAWEWEGASIHPAKLAQWVLSNVVERGVGLWTHCPVIDVRPTTGSQQIWKVQTLRGIMAAEKVIHCTNAHAGALINQLPPKLLTPVRMQAHSLVPPTALSGENVLKSTMVLRDGPRTHYSIHQTANDGTLIVSVGKSSGVTYDESTYSEEISREVVPRLKKLFPHNFRKDWQRVRYGEGLDHSWTGLSAHTPDKVPYVGEIEKMPNQYVCAGFNGHGMVNIFTCASGLAKVALGNGWDSTGLPECYKYSEARLAKLKTKSVV